MTAGRLALVADDAALAGQVRAALRRTLGRDVAHHSHDALPSLSDTHFLLMLAASPVESDRAMRLVQEVCIRRLPTVLFLVEANTPGVGRGLSSLDPYLSHRLRWPDDSAMLGELLLTRLGPASADTHRTPATADAIAARLMTHTPSLLPLLDRIALAAAHDVTVLLTGETGTGKTHLARLLHDYSPRAKGPFLPVPCGALPANLIESAFFGHVRGAFTGATDSKVGKFEAAGDGTILLDEIDTLPPEQQAALLRVIETGEFEPVGSNETRRTNARIIVASNWDLDEAVRAKKFRQDLYYRLNVMSFHLPPLRDRVRDISPLARGMAAKFNTRFKKDLFDIDGDCLDALEGYPWPGNIRQLENAVQQAVLVSSGESLLRDHLPPQVREFHAAPTTPMPVAGIQSLRGSREATERNVIVEALQTHGQNRSRTAAALGISRVTLYKKMRAFGLLDGDAQEPDA